MLADLAPSPPYFAEFANRFAALRRLCKKSFVVHGAEPYHNLIGLDKRFCFVVKFFRGAAIHAAYEPGDYLMATEQEEDDYYNSQSKQDSVAMAAWCFIAMLILVALSGVSYLFGGLA